jgi:hypothetical protein
MKNISIILALLMALAPSILQAASIPGLFNTGVAPDGALLPAGTVDPHYTLIESDDPEYSGPEAVTINAGFPVGPWLAEGPDSRWIAPRAEQAIGNAEGNYVYRTTFDLTGLDPSGASITGRWSVDNEGVDILINGESTGISNNSGFASWSEFEIFWGFISGVNTLDFVVWNAPATPNPTGLRVEMQGLVELPDEPPSIVGQPVSQRGIQGGTVSFSVEAQGTSPLDYQWKFNEEDLADEIDSTLLLTSLQHDQAGAYSVVVSNPFGTVESQTVELTVFDPIPGLFNTGVDSNGFPLEDYEVDPHYVLTVNPDSESTEAIVQDSWVFPIVVGPWVANSDTSKWIGPQGETSQAAEGDYVYQVTFDLTGLDPATAFIQGEWATDNLGLDILINGISTGNQNTAQFTTFTPFNITQGFLSGVNTLEFHVNNESPGYAGLRVENLRAGALAGTAIGDAPTLVQGPQPQTAMEGASVTFSSLGDSPLPLQYQWLRNGQPIQGATERTYQIPAVSSQDEGDYSVEIRNDAGFIVSPPARLTVLQVIPNLYNTGVDAEHNPLPDGEVDPHYTIIVNADSESPDAFVHDSTVFPIVEGPWVANTEKSKWIGPRFDTVDAAGGDYIYRVSFDLTGFDPATVVITGRWSSDNAGLDILLNDQGTGNPNNEQFTGFTSFTLSSGFVPGVNTLDFHLHNAGVGYTGLRVEDLQGGGRPSTNGDQPILSAARGEDGQLLLSWPDQPGFVLESAAQLAPANWTTAPETVTQEGGLNQVAVQPSEAERYFRLRN